MPDNVNEIIDQDEQVGGQAAYRETPYAPESWEILGEYDDHPEFQPMQLEVLQREELIIDPMFADYGGISRRKAALRYHVSEDAEQIYAEADQQPEQQVPRVSLTEEELEQIKNEAIESGRQQVRQELESKEQERWAGLEQRFQTVINDLIAQVKQHQEEIEKSAVNLTLEISRRIIAQAVEINPEYIVDIINQAVAKAGGAAIRKIRVSPEDMEFIEVVGIARKIKDYDQNWVFESDGSIRSGCIVETSAGQIDFQLDAAWERIKEQVVRVL